MALLMVSRAGTLDSATRGARLAIAGGASVDLPWWPDEIAATSLAPAFTDTARRNRSPHQTRDDDPLAKWRLSCTVSGRDPDESVQGIVDAVTAIAAGSDTDSLVELHLGDRFAGQWLIVDAGWTATAWTSSGAVASADVIIELREPSTASVRVGPIPSKPRPGKGGKK